MENNGFEQTSSVEQTLKEQLLTNWFNQNNLDDTRLCYQCLFTILFQVRTITNWFLILIVQFQVQTITNWFLPLQTECAIFESACRRAC